MTVHTLYFHFRQREEWSRLRRALAPKMLRPKDIRDNLENFNDVTRDAVEHMVAIRREDDVIPDLEIELAKWATECKFCITEVPSCFCSFAFLCN